MTGSFAPTRAAPTASSATAGPERRREGAFRRPDASQPCRRSLRPGALQRPGARDAATRRCGASSRPPRATRPITWPGRGTPRQLGARPSLLNPLWYAGAFGLGLLAGRAGDATSLGFVVETERQVEQHLESHLDRLPAGDAGSRAVVEQMKRDEAGHATSAEQAGAVALPAPVRWAMRLAAKVMTTTAHYV